MERLPYIIGSHNTFSYLKPTRWWMRPLTWAARCQSAPLSMQHWGHKADCFDLRVRTDRHGNTILAHGLVEYPSDNLLEDLNDMETWAKHQRIYCRVVLELNKRPKDMEHQRKRFIDLCGCLQTMFPHVLFFGGRLKYNWEKLHTFKDEQTPTQVDKYSSMTNKWWWKYSIPWLYARLNNHANMTAGTDKEIMLIDFVDIK